MRVLQKLSFVLLLAVLFLACKKEDSVKKKEGERSKILIPPGFPAVAFPADNAYSLQRWQLGKKLFFDPVMSSDSSISCANCHNPSSAFSDITSVSKGVKERMGSRNSPSLGNVAYHPYFTREGGVPTLEMHVLVPIQEHNEFDFNIVLIAERLKQNAEYVKMSKEAYDREPDAFVITRALATFERSLLTGNSKYDLYAFQNKTNALGPEEKKGMELFFGAKTNCSQCHGGVNFTTYSFANNGLYETYSDMGRKRLTGKEEDLALFKVPSLRNAELTSPYMHDGSLNTLEEVIEHYNTGGKNHSQKSPLVKPLNLSPQEKVQLLAFLKSLTDFTFINNPNFSE